MLAIIGALNVWFIVNVNDMRLGRRCLLEIVKDRFLYPYNGDLFVFLLKNRQQLKMVRCEHHRYMLYELEYERGYKFIQPVYEDGHITHFELDFNYLVALLKCLVVSKLNTSSCFLVN